jgi:hypothetical protein
MPIRACRDCGEEYRPDAEVSICADCGGPIETVDPDAARTAAAPADLAQGPYVLVGFAETAADIAPVAERLRAAGIPFGARGSTNRFELWVPESHAAAARAERKKLLASWGGEAAAETEPADGPGRCPGCDAELSADAEECSECGLAFSGDDEE